MYGEEFRIMKIIISGYYGYGSLGDEAILSGMINAFRERINESQITVLSSYPKVVEKLHNVNCLYDFPTGIRSMLTWILSKEFIHTIGAIKNADLYVFGGGGVLSDEQRWQNIPECFVRIILIKLFRLPMITYSIGAGPITKKLSKIITKGAFSQFNAVYVRDQKSKEWLQQSGVRKQIKLSADAGVLINPNYDVILKNSESTPIRNRSKRFKVGIAPAAMYFSKKRWPGKQKDFVQLQNRFAEIGDYVYEKLNADVFLFQVSPNFDTDFCRGIQKRMKKESYLMYAGYNHEDIAGSFYQMDLMIGSRFHSVVLSATVGTPFVAIIYHHKTRCFIESINQLERGVDMDVDMERLLKLIGDSWNRREEIKKELNLVMTNVKRRAYIPAIFAADIGK